MSPSLGVIEIVGKPIVLEEQRSGRSAHTARGCEGFVPINESSDVALIIYKDVFGVEISVMNGKDSAPVLPKTDCRKIISKKNCEHQTSRS